MVPQHVSMQSPMHVHEVMAGTWRDQLALIDMTSCDLRKHSPIWTVMLVGGHQGERRVIWPTSRARGGCRRCARRSGRCERLAEVVALALVFLSRACAREEVSAGRAGFASSSWCHSWMLVGEIVRQFLGRPDCRELTRLPCR